MDHKTELEQALKATTDKLHEELNSVRSNRPSVQLLEGVLVDCYGQMMPLKGVGSLGIRPPRDIEITPWDKSLMPIIAKAIESANLGLSVSADSSVVRASLPVLTQERREEFMKLAKRMAEDSRIQIRNKRDDAMKRLKVDEDSGALNEDQVFKLKETLQKVVEAGNKTIEELLEHKLAELAE